MRLGSALGLSIQRQIQLNNTNSTRALERLSSGLRINRAADDAGGLALSETLRAQKRGTAQAIRNVQDGMAMVQTADGAFEQIQAMLQRMREISVQGANGTYALADRLAMQEELEQLKRGIDQVAMQAQFNGINLLADQGKQLRQTGMPYSYLGSAAVADPVPAPYNIWTDNRSASFLTGGGATVGGVSPQEVQDAVAQLPFLMDGALRKAEGMLLSSGLDQSILIPPDVYYVIDPANPQYYDISDTNVVVINLAPIYGAPGANPDMTLQQAFAEAMGDLLVRREDNFASGAGGDLTAWITASGSYDNMSLFFAEAASENYLSYNPPAAFSFDAVDADFGASASAWFARYLMEKHGQDAVQEIASIVVNADGAGKGAMAAQIDTYLTGLTGLASRAAIEADVQAWIATQPTATQGVTRALSNTADQTAQLLGDEPTELQVGPNQSDVFDLSLYAGACGNLDYAALVAVTDAVTAQRSIATLDKAIAIASDARANLGAQYNRLEHTYGALATDFEELTAAESRIRDTDMASEATEMTRAQLMVVTSQDQLKTMHDLRSGRAATLLASALQSA